MCFIALSRIKFIFKKHVNQEKSSICHDGENYTKCFNKKFADQIDFGHEDGGVGHS